MKVLAELYQNDWEKVKQFIVFHPKDFVMRCLEMSEKHKREKAIVWDDAGLWLFAMQHNDIFVQSVIKYLNVARTNWAAMILTTPTPSWVIFKMRNFPQNVRIKIIKTHSDLQGVQRLRMAKAYKSWMAPDFRHSGVRNYYQDNFDATMPQDFYEWYRPVRDGYARQANELMQKSLKHVLKRDAHADVEAIAEAYTS